MKTKERIFVTGGTGLLGKDLVPRLLDAGFQVELLVRSRRIVPFSFHPQLKIKRGDITDFMSLRGVSKRVDAVVHLAANKYHPTLSYRVNVDGAHNLKRVMQERGIKRLINISTQATKIKRKGVYGKSKMKSDEILHNSKFLDVTTIKPSLVYGEDKDSLFHTIASYVKMLPIVPIIGDGSWQLFPIWVGDVSTAIINCLKDKKTIGKVYDLGCWQRITMNQLVEEIAKSLKKPIKKIHIPVFAGMAGAKALSLISENPRVTRDNILGSTQDTGCKPRKAIKELKLKPLTVKQGISLALKGNQKNQIRTAIVGMGKMGLLHTAILNSLPQARVVALIDTDPTLRKTAKTLGIDATVYSSITETIDHERLDLVFICSPTHTHLTIATTCLKNNLNVFIEKPTATNYQEVQKLLSLSREHPKLRICTGYYYLYRPLYRKLREILKQGIIGSPRSFFGTAYHSEVFGPKRGWLFDPRKSGGGVLINPSPHLFSLIVDFFGTPQRVKCTTKKIYSQWVEDEASVKLHYQNMQGTVQASWSKKGYPVLQTNLTIKGSNGTLRSNGSKIVLKLKQAKRGYRAGNTKILQEDLSLYQKTFNLNPQQGAEGYFLQDQDIITAIQKDKQPQNSITFAVKVEKLIAKCYQSAAKGRRVIIK